MNEHRSLEDDQKLIQSFQFSTASLDANEQFDGYREFMEPLADVEPLVPSDGGFRAHAQIYDLGLFQLIP